MLGWTTEFLTKHGCETPRLDAEILLAHARRCRRIELYTDYAEIVDQPTREAMRELVKRRSKKEPVAYLVGYREFYGLEFLVNPHVLVPRPETETLLLEALESARTMESPQVLDLCTGSGCLAISFAKLKLGAMVTATDVSADALEVAQQNSLRHEVNDRVDFLRGDLFAAIPEAEKFDLILSNPPYVCSDEIEKLDLDVKAHEPHLALDGGTEGLDFIIRILENAPRFLKPNGKLFIEFSPEQADQIRELAPAASHAEHLKFHRDLSGQHRVVELSFAGDL